MTAPTTPTSGPFRESDPIESATTLILNMVAEQQELSIAAREGFGDPALYRLWLALGQLRGKNGLHLQDGRLPLCDLSNREGQVGEALTEHRDPYADPTISTTEHVERLIRRDRDVWDLAIEVVTLLAPRVCDAEKALAARRLVDLVRLTGGAR